MLGLCLHLMCCSSAVISDNKWFESMWKQLVISVVGPRYEHLTHCSLLASGNSLEEQGVIAFHSLPALLRLERCFLDGIAFLEEETY